MFKKIILTFLFLTISFCLAEETEEIIQAGIKYNEMTARIEAFKDIQTKIERKTIKNYLKDPNRKENLEAIFKDKYEIGLDRILCPFYFKKTLISYAVTYYNEPSRTYYYNIFGRLMKFEVMEGGRYPTRTFAYSNFGNLLTVNFDIDGNEQFMYDEKGNLVAHWVDNNYEGKHSKILKITRGENPNKNEDDKKSKKQKQKELKTYLDLKEDVKED